MVLRGILENQSLKNLNGLGQSLQGSAGHKKFSLNKKKA